MKTLRMMAIAVMLAPAAGCGGREPRVHTPGTVAGEYVLVERQGQPLPHAMDVPFEGQACTVTLVRLVLTLREDGVWTEDGQGRTTCRAEATDTAQGVHGAGRYELRGPRGDTLLMRDTLNPDLSVQTGVLAGNEIRAVLPVPPPLDTLRFRYVRQRPRD